MPSSSFDSLFDDDISCSDLDGALSLAFFSGELTQFSLLDLLRFTVDTVSFLLQVQKVSDCNVKSIVIKIETFA